MINLKEIGRFTLLPEIIIEYILNFAPNFRDNLKRCQEEMLDKHRPCYYKKVLAGFSPGIADSPTWHNFKKNNEIKIWRRSPNVENYGRMECMILNLHGIEITPHRPPNDRFWHDRDMVLYYGWSKPTNKYFWDTILKWNRNSEEFTPGYY